MLMANLVETERLLGQYITKSGSHGGGRGGGEILVIMSNSTKELCLCILDVDY
jgi:hypothetical protein